MPARSPMRPALGVAMSMADTTTELGNGCSYGCDVVDVSAGNSDHYLH
jgi:hypothetical protein